MQLPSVERSLPIRPAAADGGVSAAGRVVPVAPVNPPEPQVRAVEGVVNDIRPAVRGQVAQEGDPPPPDPLRGGAQADSSQRDWTQRRPAPPKVEEPPKEPISKMLIEHVHAMWQASAKAVESWWQQYSQAQNPTQQQTLQQTRNQIPTAIPGVLTKEVLTYSPDKVKKTGGSESSSAPDTRA